MKLYKLIIELIEKRLNIRKIYKEGIGQAFFLLRFILPSIFILIFLFLISTLNLTEMDFKDLIKQINSLVGIILGFSIASFAIFISISNEKLEKVSRQTNYTYRQIGSSLFFYNVEVALFTSLIGIFLLYIELPIVDISDLFVLISNPKFNITNFFSIEIILFVVYLVMFFQLMFNLFYSSLFLNSSINKD